MVDSCQRCDQCRKGEEQLCREGNTQTYNDKDRITGEPTYGGYSKHLVVREEFALRVPDEPRSGPRRAAALRRHHHLFAAAAPGTSARAAGSASSGSAVSATWRSSSPPRSGADVTVLSRSTDKEADALGLGADRLLVSTDAAAMAEARSRFDLIIDTVPVKHDINPYLPLLDVDGTLVLVGQLGPLPEPHTLPLLMGRRRIAGSPIGGIAETQEMLDFCAAQEHPARRAR